MERDTGDDSGARAQRDKNSNPKPSSTKKPFFWWDPPTGPDGRIAVTESELWMQFHANLTDARRWLGKYLEHMNNIRNATSCASAPLDELQVTNVVRLFPRCQEPVSSVPSSISTRGVDIDQERNMMKKYADLALLELRQMDEILDVMERLDRRYLNRLLDGRSSPGLSIAWSPGFFVFFILAVTVTFPTMAWSVAASCNYCLFRMVEPKISPFYWQWFTSYNLACVHQQVLGLLRALKEERISEKNRKDLDSWHLWARWWISAKFGTMDICQVQHLKNGLVFVFLLIVTFNRT